MTEEEKLDAGLYYDFWDVGVKGRKLNAIKFCRELRRMQDADATEAKIFMLGISFLQITMSQFLISCRCILAIM